MSNQKLGILAAVAAVMVMWAVVQSRLARRASVEPSGPTYLIQGLDAAQIGSIVVGHGDAAVTIEQKDGRFVVANKSGYPADTKQLNDLVTKCLDIKTTELYTSNPKNHEDLEVTEAKAGNVITFLKPDGTLLTGVLVGKSLETGKGTYVRKASEDEVYLTETAPWFRSTALEYVDKTIATVKREDVNTVTVTTPDGAYTLRPGAGADGVVMANVPAGKQLKASDAKSVLGALTSLQFSDVNAPADVTGLSFDHDFVCRLNDSTEYTLKLAKKGEKTYLMCSADYMDKTPVTKKPGQVESEEALKVKEAILMAREQVQRFTLRHKNWIYEIADWKAKFLVMTPSDLLEDKAPAVVEDVVQPAGPLLVPVQPVPAPEPNAVK